MDSQRLEAMPEKPPVAAKPKPKPPAPKPPPKPKGQTSPTKTIINNQSPASSPSTSDSPITKPLSLSISDTANQNGTQEILSNHKTDHPPPLPCSPPPVQRKNPLSPSPNSVRSPLSDSQECSVTSQSTTSSPSISSLSPTVSSLSPSSPLSPKISSKTKRAPKAPPSISPKPKLLQTKANNKSEDELDKNSAQSVDSNDSSCDSTQGKVSEASSTSENKTEESPLRDERATSLTTDSTASVITGTITASTTDDSTISPKTDSTTSPQIPNKQQQVPSKSSPPNVPPKKPVPARPTSPPSRPLLVTQTAVIIPQKEEQTSCTTPDTSSTHSQSSDTPHSIACASTISTSTHNESDHMKSTEAKPTPDLTTPSTTSTTTKKSSVPPPLPKNPPRGGIPRKPRTTRSSKASDAKPGSVSLSRSNSQTSGSSDTQSAGVSRSNSRTSDSGDRPLLERKPVDSSSPQIPSNKPESFAQKLNNCLKGKEHTASEVSVKKRQNLRKEEGITSTESSSTPTPPKPRPRTRSSFPSEAEVPPKDSVENSEPSTKGNKAKEKSSKRNYTIPLELDYAEPYRGSSEEPEDPKTVSNEKSENSYDTGIFLDISKDEIDSECLSGNINIIDNKKSSSNACAKSPDSIKAISEAKDLLSGEPGATCDMLKEIEALLNSRLESFEEPDAELTAHHEHNESSNSNPDDLSLRDSCSSSPIRPPRPKRQANLCRLRGSVESLESSSTECLVSAGSNKKVVPPKPKRTTLPRVNRSLSDVSGMSPGLSGHKEKFFSKSSSVDQDSKPYLPPRTESLRRSDSFNSNSDSPPPLPPRNKPRSCSFDTETESPPLPARMASDEHVLSVREALNKLQSPPPRPVKKPSPAPGQKSATLPAQIKSHQGKPSRPAKPRPTRQAPPPPPGAAAARRSATFSAADAKGANRSAFSAATKKVDDVAVTLRKDKTEADQERRRSLPEDHYHEIPDDLRRVKESSPSKDHPNPHRMTPPPRLPPPRIDTAEPQVQPNRFDTAKRKKAKAALVKRATEGIKQSENSNANTSFESTDEGGHQRADNPEHDDDSNGESFLRPDSHKNSVSRSSSSSSPPRDRPLSFVSTGSEQEDHVSGVLNESSESEMEEEIDEEIYYARKKAKKVFFIAQEIMTSEEAFVNVLRLLNVDFRLHISQATEKLGQPVVPTESLNKILDFLPQLQNFNEELLKDLKDRIQNWEKEARLSDIFVKKGPFLKLYSSYIKNFENATAALDDALKKNPNFAAAVKEFEMSPKCAMLGLKHYMLKPIQRIPQYRLLLQDYLKHLTEESPDYKDTITALTIVSEVADHANESMRHGDNVQKLMEVQRSLIGQFEVIQPGRELIKQGELQKLSRKEMQPRWYFLFTDVLLYTTPATGGYRINNVLPLTGMKVSCPKVNDYQQFEFNIISTQRSFTVCASSLQEKNEWMDALQKAISKHVQRYHSFEVGKHEPHTSLRDKDFVLGSRAPLWVPDARVTMCMLCLVEFTLTWRRHHCRACGRITCAQCSDNKAPLRYLKYKAARVCDECYKKLHEEAQAELAKTVDKHHSSHKSQSEEDAHTLEVEAEDKADGDGGKDGDGGGGGGLSFSSFFARFQKVRTSNREKKKPNRPSVLKEVRANDEGSDMSGYLWTYKKKTWKKMWYVVKGKVLYTYKASEDMAAVESMPLLGYEIARVTSWFEGAEPDLLFELTHQNNQLLVTRKGGETLSPKVLPGADKTTQRLIFKTDSAAAANKWMTVLREATLT